MNFTGGLPETHCGLGSTLGKTKLLRRLLPPLLKDLGVKKLLDAPCGDCNWISHVNLGVRYHGIDFSEQYLQTASSRVWSHPVQRSFQLGNIMECKLPDADAVMCRDFFQHLKTDKVIAIIRRLEASKIKWLLATSFDNGTNEELGPDMFRPLNLELAPFFKTAPLVRIPDPPNSGRTLSVWRIN